MYSEKERIKLQECIGSDSEKALHCRTCSLLCKFLTSFSFSNNQIVSNPSFLKYVRQHPKVLKIPLWERLLNNKSVKHNT